MMVTSLYGINSLPLLSQNLEHRATIDHYALGNLQGAKSAKQTETWADSKQIL